MKKISNQDVYECIRNIVPQITDDIEANIFDSGLIDSLNLLEVIMGLEQCFNVSFDAEDVRTENFSSLSQITDTLRVITERKVV